MSSEKMAAMLSRPQDVKPWSLNGPTTYIGFVVQVPYI